MILHIDLETYSSVDLKKSGLYRYVQSPDFEILLFAYAYDDGPVQVIQPAAGEQIPEKVIYDLRNPEVLKMAYNAAFEFYCLSKFYITWPAQWQCTMIHALYCGYPRSLAAAGDALGLPRDRKKLGTGKALIRFFCVPCKPTVKNGQRTRNLPAHDPERWKLFVEYCRQDVVTERTIENRLAAYPVPGSEWDLWRLDLLINMYGAATDRELVSGALAISREAGEELKEKARDITGLDNPNSVAQLKAWIERNTGLEIDSLNKQTVADILSDKSGSDAVLEMLKIRQELCKTSVKKYETMEACMCEDGRIRGLLQFYGANRTGRWAGRLVQVQNLPRNYIGTLDTARELVKSRNTEAVKLIYGNVPDTLSQLIRTAFVPASGCHYAVADFSAIEARVIAWLSGESWRMEVFQTHGKIYEASAANMFGVPQDSIVKGNPNYALRAKGKIAELALGYGGSTGALISMGALRMGLTEDELPEIVQRWRGSNRRICGFWRQVQSAAEEAVTYGVITALDKGVVFSRDPDYLIITLPSGRSLYYNRPGVEKNEAGRDTLYFYGVDKKWTKIRTWGGKLVENIVQAVARDLLANALQNLHAAGYRICFHIHDEVVMEIPDSDFGRNLEDAVRLMCTLPPWAAGLPLNADGFDHAAYYKKD